MDTGDLDMDPHAFAAAAYNCFIDTYKKETTHVPE
jgi:hypothetical protein